MHKNSINEVPVNRHEVSVHKIRGFYPLMLLVAGFILWRYCFLVFTDPQYLSVSQEEFHRVSVAREMLSHSISVLWNSRPDNYSGGYFVIVVFLAGFLKLFGFSVLAFKSVSILWGALALAVWYSILRKYVNPRAAWIFGLLFILSPQPVTGLSTVVLGDHAETILLSALSVLLYFKSMDVEHPYKRLLLLSLCFLAGFSLWFAYIYAITIAALLVFSIFSLRKINIRIVPAGIIAFIAGFSLWGVTYWKNHFQSLVVQGAPLWQSFSWRLLVGPFYSWKQFFIVRMLLEMPHRPLSGSLYGVTLALYAVFLIGALSLSFMKTRRSEEHSESEGKKTLENLFLFFFLMNLAACQFYDDLGLRFLLPAYPFVMAWIASRFSRLRQRFYGLPIFILIVLILCGAATTFERFSFMHRSVFLNQELRAEPISGVL